jgi:hypothetical protein
VRRLISDKGANINVADEEVNSLDVHCYGTYSSCRVGRRSCWQVDMDAKPLWNIYWRQEPR